MITFDTTYKSLQLRLDDEITTDPLQVVCTYEQITSRGRTDETVEGLIEDTEPLTIVDAPPHDSKRTLKFISVYNSDTALATITIELNNGGVTREIGNWVLGAGFSLIYNYESGFGLYNAAGVLQTGVEQTSSGGGTTDVFEYVNFASFPAAGQGGVVYIDAATGDLYRWNGTAYSKAGYTDAKAQAFGDTRYSLLAHTHTFASLTAKPTTLSGYGITDIPLSADATTNKYLNWNGSAYIRKQIAYSEISGTPSIPTQYTDEMSQDAFAAMMSSEFTYADATPLLSINAIAQSKITGLVTDLGNKVTANAAITGATKTKITYDSKGLVTVGADLVAGDIPDLSATYSPVAHTHTFASLTAKPTTIAGYGITDAFTQATADTLYSPLGHTHTFASLTAKPTTLSGYGITDAEPALGNPSTNGYVLSSTTAGVRSWVANGNVTKVGTTLDNQIAVWTGDGTIEGSNDFAWNGSSLNITGALTASGTIRGNVFQGNEIGSISTPPSGTGYVYFKSDGKVYSKDDAGVEYDLTAVGSPMVYPAAGIALSTGSAWGTSITDNSANWNTAFSQTRQWDGGATGLVAATGRTSLGGTTVGQNVFIATNPSAIRWIRVNADNTITFRTAAETASDIGALTSYTETDPLALKIASNLSDLNNAGTARTNLGATTLGSNLFTIANNATSVKWLRINADNTITQRTAAETLTDIGAQPLDSDLTTIAGLTATTDNFIVSVSNAWASRTPSQVRTTLGLVIGTNVQAWDGDLDAIAALSGTSGFLKKTAANTWSLDTATYLTTETDPVVKAINGIVKSNGTTISAAVAGTDYQAPITLTTTGTSGAATFVSNTLNIPQYSGATPANPTVSIGLTAINGVAATFMRSDSAPALSQAIVPTWTGTHTFQKNAIGTTSTDAVILANNTISSSGAGAVQQSPNLRFMSHAWKPTGGGSDQQYEWRIKNVPNGESSNILRFTSEIIGINTAKDVLELIGSHIGGSAQNRVTVNGQLYTDELVIQTTPAVSGGTYDILTRNATGGVETVPSNTFAAATGSTAYIHNQTSQQASSNFNISGAGVIGSTLTINSATHNINNIKLINAAPQIANTYEDQAIYFGYFSSGVDFSSRIVGQTKTADHYGSRLKFQTHGTGTSASYIDALILNESGNATFAGSITGTSAYFSGTVGIGMTAVNKLDVEGFIKAKTTADLYSGVSIGGAGTNLPEVKFHISDDSIRGKIGVILDGANPDRLGFFVYAPGTLLEKMSINGNGNVLINTTTDSGYKLDVNGTGRFSGALTGTTATFSEKVTVNGTNGNVIALFSGSTKALRVIPSAAGIEIAGVDNTGTTSYQPLTIDGSSVTINPVTTFNNSVGIGGSAANAVTLLDVASTTKGVRFTPMTTTQRNGITAIDGLMIYNTTLAEYQYYDGINSLWKAMAAATGAGSGTVTSVSVTTANGVSGSVATPTTTPAITLTLGAITPSSIVASGVIVTDTYFQVRAAAGSNRQIVGTLTDNTARWSLLLGDNAAEGGSNAGSNFALYRYNDAGAYLGAPLQFARATGAATFETDVNITSGKYKLGGTTVLYIPPSMGGSFVVGDGGTALSHTTADEGYRNTFVGIGAGQSVTTGWQNTLVGHAAGATITTGENNTGVGRAVFAGSAALTGSNNMAIGTFASYYNTSGIGNVGVGMFSNFNTTTGSTNTSIGYYAGVPNTTGGNNVNIGANAGYNSGVVLSTNSSTTFVGYGANSSVNGVTNSTALGNGAQVTASNQMVFGNTSVTANVFNGTISSGSITSNNAITAAGNVTAAGVYITDIVSNRGVRYQTSGVTRWFQHANSTAEGGSDAGSDFVLTRYNDAGASLGSVLTFTRSTGNAVFSGNVAAASINGNTITTGTGTLTIGAGKTLTQNATQTFAGVDGKTLTFNNTLTFAGTDATTMTFPSTSATLARTDAAQSFTGVQTLLSAPIFSAGISPSELPNGLNNGNTARQSQAVVSATNYYITNSNLNFPATLKGGLVTGSRFIWRVAMDKTAAGTGVFQIAIYRGTNGSTADTQDVLQTIGTQTAAVDSMVVDVVVTVTATGASGSYYWTIIPVNKAITATGFGVVTGTTGYFAGTVSSVALNTTSLKFGLGFKSTTGTPTISIPMVQARVENFS